MKKLFSTILVLCFLLGGNAYAGQQELIEKYLKDRKLDPIEGVWHNKGHIAVMFKDNQTYKSASLETNNTLRCGEYDVLTKLGENYFQYKRNEYQGENNGKRTGCKKRNPVFTFSYLVNNNILNITGSVNVKGVTPWNTSMTRIWPEDIISHNAKYKTDEDIKNDEKQLALIVNDVKKTCGILGFEPGSEKFADCTLKLYTQKIDEKIAAKQEANNRSLQTSSSSTTTQSSAGTNTTIIYDPVRDKQNKIDRGMKMLGGKCTLGVDC